VIITWDAPDQGWSDITRYRIIIKQSNGTYTEQLDNCNGIWASVVRDRICTVPLLVLQADPYNWILGDSIYAKVSASNVWGESAMSTAGNGATIVTIPSPPIYLLNNATVTSDTKIGFSWSDGL